MREQFQRRKMITNNMLALKINFKTWITSNRGELNPPLSPKAKATQGTSPRARCAPDAWKFWEMESASDVTSSTTKASNRDATTETASPKKSQAFKSNNSQPLAKPTNPDNQQPKTKSKHKVEHQSNSINQDSNPKHLNLKMTNMKEEVTITNASNVNSIPSI